ncbi:MAG: hypothetical protein OK457_06840 [Thaumarchaeota archaeon]|nr:hypothetical protein [Nitrososphaerota archaeon]
MGENLARLKTVIVCSLCDPAGTNIRERLLEKFPFVKSENFFDGSPIYSLASDILLVSSRKEIIFVDDLEDTFQDVRFVFISKHRAESGIPSLTAHFTGNFGSASFGGKEGEIAHFSPSVLKNYLIALAATKERINKDYGITIEATHHGPTSLDSPVLFVELGSTEIQWADMETAGVIANAVVSAIRDETAYGKCAIGIGGTHYPQKLTQLIIESEFALGPVVPKYALEFFSRTLIDQILKKSDQEIKYALVDQKGLGKFKESVNRTVEEAGLEKISI